MAAQQQSAALRGNLQAFIERLWASLGTYRAAQMATFVNEVTPVVQGAQRQMAALTSAWIAAQKSIVLGGNTTPRPVDLAKVTGAPVRKGTSSATVYERPFHLVWRQLDELPREPGSIEQAIEAGQKRAVQSALTDLQLTKRAAAQQFMASDKDVVGYRRVLEGTYSCALCIVASTQRYHKAELLPVHPACDCGVVEIYGDADPGQIIEPGTLEDVHARVRETFGVSNAAARAIPSKGLPDYRDVLIVHEHGELGPVLAVKGRPFLGPNDV